MAERCPVDWVDAESTLDCYAEIEFFPHHARFQRFLRVPVGFKSRALEVSYVDRLSLILTDRMQSVAFAGLCAVQLLAVVYLALWLKFDEPTALDVIFLFLWFGATLVGCCRKRIIKSGEPVLLIMMYLCFVLALLTHPYRQAYPLSLLGQVHPHLDVFANTPDSIHLIFASIVLVAIYQSNIRSTRCWIMIPVVPVTYLACSLPLPHDFVESFMNRFAIAIGMLILTVILFIGHCDAETLDRAEFLRMQQVRSSYVKEKVLRCTAEHQLEAAVPVKSRPEDDQASMPDSSHFSSAVFFPGYPDRDEQLKALIVVGEMEQWLIHSAQVTCSFKHCIGKGGFGQVFQGMCSSAPAAIKIVAAPLGQEGLGSIATELRILRKVRHANIVAFYGACILPHAQNILLVEELIQGDSLSKVVGLKVPGVKQCHHMLLGVCSGLAYLHSHQPPIVDADLKPGNIMVERPLSTVRLIDFGLSAYSSLKRRGKTGTTRWQAPETLKTHAPDISSDIYSLGCVAFYTKTGCLPFAGISGQALLNLRTATLTEGVDSPLSWPEPPVDMQDECQALCAKCMFVDPGNRAKAPELLRCLASWFFPGQSDDESPAERALRDGLMLVTGAQERPGNPTVDQAKHAIAL